MAKTIRVTSATSGSPWPRSSRRVGWGGCRCTSGRCAPRSRQPRRFQRSLTNPLAVILVVAVVRHDSAAPLRPDPQPPRPVISAYHYLIERFPSLEHGTSCDPTNPRTTTSFLEVRRHLDPVPWHCRRSCWSRRFCSSPYCPTPSRTCPLLHATMVTMASNKTPPRTLLAAYLAQAIQAPAETRRYPVLPVLIGGMVVLGIVAIIVVASRQRRRQGQRQRCCRPGPYRSRGAAARLRRHCCDRPRATAPCHRRSSARTSPARK